MADRFSTPPRRTRTLAPPLPVTNNADFLVNIVGAVSGQYLGQLKVDKSKTLLDVRGPLVAALGGGRLYEAHLVTGSEVFDKPFQRPFANAIDGDTFNVLKAELDDMVYLDVVDRKRCPYPKASDEMAAGSPPSPSPRPDRILLTSVPMAAQASDSGQFDEALQVIASCDARMKAAKNKTPLSEALGLELEDARSRMCTRQSWEDGGRAEMMDACQMHSVQRCSSISHSSPSIQKSSKSMYMSVTQGDWIKKSKGNSSRGWF